MPGSPGSPGRPGKHSTADHPSRAGALGTVYSTRLSAHTLPVAVTLATVPEFGVQVLMFCCGGGGAGMLHNADLQKRTYL